jgi:hypothetical protein
MASIIDWLDDKFAGLGTERGSVGSKYNKQNQDRFLKTKRLPFLIGRESSKDIKNYLYFYVNPSQCSWKVGLRSTIEKVAGGAIHHEWPTSGIGIQSPDVLIDHPIISFSFQSGAIYPGAHEELTEANANQPPIRQVPEGLGNFYDFLDILGQSNLMAGGKPNYVNIAYTSNIFPSIWLQGFFTEEGVNWDDSADNPNQVGNWGASFMVFNSTPSLHSAEEMKNHFQSYGFNSFYNGGYGPRRR